MTTNGDSGVVRKLAVRWEPSATDSALQRPNFSGGEDLSVRERKGIPELNKKFLQEMLRREGRQVEVVSFTVVKGSEDNYSSSMIEVNLMTTDHDSISLLFKTVHVTPQEAKVLNVREMFKKEVLMYQKVVPTLIGLFPSDPLNVFTPSYHSHEDLLVFENLRPLGFRHVDREQGLDLAHANLVLTELGRLHGAAYVEAILARKYDILLELLRPKDDAINLLNHGDLWTGNLLFRYTDRPNKVPVQVVFLDLQLCRYGSPGLDVNYFLYTSTTARMREEHLDELLRTYHWSLVRTFRQLNARAKQCACVSNFWSCVCAHPDISTLGMKQLTLFDLRREVERTALYGFLSAEHLLRNHVGRAEYEERIVDMVLEFVEHGTLPAELTPTEDTSIPVQGQPQEE
uniref:CHK kinase-like domain-containing protein n=1 Tax=Timema shepardi TaxID=629360 RepID=A0A7R9B733_TIMSH|nr:unnamed protein product [Timema shepardi]